MDYTKEAEDLIKVLGIEKGEFEGYYFNSNIAVGSTAIFQYLGEKKRWNAECKITSEEKKKLRITLGEQAKVVAKKIIGFNEGEFKVWFANALTVSYTEVFEYFMKKETEFKKKLEV